MIVNNINNLSKNSINFQKILVANAGIKGSDHETTPCKIYELEPDLKSDRDYLCNIEKNDPNWQGSYYLRMVKNNFLDEQSVRKHIGSEHPDDIDSYTAHYYVLVNNENKCMGFCTAIYNTSAVHPQKTEIEYLETAPAYRNGTYNYIGQTLLALVAKISLNKYKNNDIIVASAPEAENFYLNKCYFKDDLTDGSGYLHLSKNRFKKLIEQNEKNTGQKIEYLC